MNPPLFSFRGANIEQKSDSANFFAKKMQKKLFFISFILYTPLYDLFLQTMELQNR